jgi:GNAT superfamily N-acetyltransferase
MTYLIDPIGPGNKNAFLALIQEQAAQHKAAIAHDESAADALHQATCKPDGTNAFVVVAARDNTVVGTATYYPCVTMHGAGIYLDDIVTTASERGKGVGSFALSHLAQRALQVGKYIALECAFHNANAQKFYDGLRAKRLQDRHTWRKLGAFHQASVEATSAQVAFTIRPTKSSDADAVAKLFAQHANKESSGVILGIQDGSIIANRDFVLTVAEDHSGKVVGAVIAHRSYSSFRNEAGIHMDRMTMNESSPGLAQAFLAHYGKIQQARNWSGNLDITIDNGDALFLKPIFMRHGITPLSYGNDPMVVRRIEGHALVDLAQRTALPKGIEERLSRPRSKCSGGRLMIFEGQQ